MTYIKNEPISPNQISDNLSHGITYLIQAGQGSCLDHSFTVMTYAHSSPYGRAA